MSTLTSMDVGNDQGEDYSASRRKLAGRPAKSVTEQLVEGDFLDLLFDKVDAGELRLTGEGGFIPTMIKAVLKRGCRSSSLNTSAMTRPTRRVGAARICAAAAPSKTIQSELGPLGLRHPAGPGVELRRAVGPEELPSDRQRPGRDDHQPLRRWHDSPRRRVPRGQDPRGRSLPRDNLQDH